MITVNLADAKSHLSQYLDSGERGETAILCRRNVPIAEIRPLPQPPTEPRPIGTDPDFVVPDSFFEPLPEDLLDAFEGGGADHSSEPAERASADALEQVNQRCADRLRVFYDQKDRPPNNSEPTGIVKVNRLEPGRKASYPLVMHTPLRSFNSSPEVIRLAVMMSVRDP